MAKIASSVIEEIRALNITDVISTYVELTRRGRSIVGLCPFHNEKTPSFHVSEDKGFFKCFGCNEAGDSITFVMKYKNFDYVDAVKFLCENYGIELKYDNIGSVDTDISKLKELHEQFMLVAEKYLYADEGGRALNYLNKRGFSKELLSSFNIGYVPPKIDIRGLLTKYSESLLIKSGIFYKGRYGIGCSFAGRILFPIKNSIGVCVGFSGRSMDPQDKAKYRNSTETAIFSKRRELFNFSAAKDHMVESKSCFIVEGYFDVMRMYEADYKNTVAIMGTAFTREQVSLLKRYCEEFNIMLDGDEAGSKAMQDSLRVSLESNIYPYVVFLPDGEDPDTLLKNDPQLFTDSVNSKVDLIMHIIQSERDKAKDNNTRFHRLNGVKKILESIKDPYRREYYTQNTADIFGVSVDMLLDGVMDRPKQTVIKKVNRKSADAICEKDFLAALICLDEQDLKGILNDTSEDYFEDPDSIQVYKKLVEIMCIDGTINAFTTDNEFNEYKSRLLTRCMDLNDKPLVVAQENKNQLKLRFLNKSRTDIIQRLSAPGDKSSQEILLQELQTITKDIKLLQSHNIKIN